MAGRSIRIIGVVFFLNACTYEAPTSTNASSTQGAGGGSTSSGSASGTGGLGGGGAGGGGAGGAGASGGGGPTALACGPLPMPNGATIVIDASQVADLPSIVYGAMSGTTIVLAPGTYTIPNSLHFINNDVSLRSTTNKAEDVIIDGSYMVNETIVINASNVTIAHVTVMRAIDHPIHVYPPATGIIVNGTFLYGLRLIDGGEQFVKANPIGESYVDEGRVECSSFELTDVGRPNVDPGGDGCYTGGIDVHTAWKWRVRNNTFRGIYCPSGLAEHAIHFWKGSRDTLVENNVIIDCARGIGFGLGGGGGDRKYADNPYGDATLAHYDGIIRNNVVYGNIPGFDTGIEIAEAREPQLYHNTVIQGLGASGFYSGIDYRFPQTRAVIRNNLATKITPRDGASGIVDTNFENVPLEYFVSPSSGDFHLTPMAKSAIDQGVPIDAAGFDMDGEPHTLGGGPDLGADELKP